MKCLFLAAGYATRLYPLTENFPKPLLKVVKTILDWLLDDVDESKEVDEYVVVTNHKYAYHFDDWAVGKQQKITVIENGTKTNETRLGAVKDMQYAIEKNKLDSDMLVIAGDNLLDFSLKKFIKYTKGKKTSCIMRYYEPNEDKIKKSGVIRVDDDDLVLHGRKPHNPKSNWCCPPFYYISQRRTVTK